MSAELAARLRTLLSGRPGIAEKRIVGGTGFMLHGNLAFGTTGRGDLLVRIDPATEAAALARPGASRAFMGARPMTGYVSVAATTLPDAALADWLDYALTFAEILPPK